MTASDGPPPDRRPWWSGVGATAMSVHCGGSQHRLRWAHGQLLAADHPDADRERALVALGGERVACLELFDAFTAHSDDLDLLVLASRGPSDRLLGPEPGEGVRYSGGYSRGSTHTAISYGSRPARRGGPVRSGRGWAMYRPLNSGSLPYPGFAPEDEGFGVAALANLGGGLTDRLVATVMATWTERIRDADDRVPAATPALHAALYGRVLTTIRSMTSQPNPLDLVMVRADAPRSIILEDGRIRCALPFSWLSDVWAKGLATAVGHLCLQVEAADDDAWHLLVVDPDLRHTRAMTIELGLIR